MAHFTFWGYIANLRSHSVTILALWLSAVLSVFFSQSSILLMRGNGDGFSVRPEMPTPQTRSYGSMASGRSAEVFTYFELIICMLLSQAIRLVRVPIPSISISVTSPGFSQIRVPFGLPRITPAEVPV